MVQSMLHHKRSALYTCSEVNSLNILNLWIKSPQMNKKRHEIDFLIYN